MIRNLFKRKSLQPKLGRWGVTYEKPVLDKRINWANHDHCGSESCKLEHLKKPKLKDKESNELDSKQNTESKNEFTEENYIENYLTAFII